VPRVITAAIKTKPLLFVAFEAVIWAPSGDQLQTTVRTDKHDWWYSPETAEECTSGRVFKGFSDLCLELPIGRSPDFYGFVVGLSSHKFANWIPTNTLYKSLMLIQLSNAF